MNRPTAEDVQESTRDGDHPSAAGSPAQARASTRRSGSDTVRRRPTTMVDVARAAGVSQSTVSRVLNDAVRAVPIAPETRERVRSAARDLGYYPNPLARGLRGARTMLIGAIVRDITDLFFTTAIEALSEEAIARGYNVVLGHAHARAEEAIALRAVLEARHCDGIVLLGDMRDQPRLIEDLRGTPVPVVALWQGSRLAGIPSVAVDNRAGIDAVLDHLTALGHRRIGFIGSRRLGDVKERERAFRANRARLGIAVCEGYIRHVANTPQAGCDAARAMLELPEPPTAVVAATDVLAIGALHGAHQRGVRVPEDLSITGFDDIPVAAFTVPALTTVRMPVREMVAACMRVVIDERGEGGTIAQPTHLVLQPSLVVRASTGQVREARVEERLAEATLL